MNTKKLSNGINQGIENIKKTALIFGGSDNITLKVTKKKTLKAVFPIKGKLHFNLFINRKPLGVYIFNGKNWESE